MSEYALRAKDACETCGQAPDWAAKYKRWINTEVSRLGRDGRAAFDADSVVMRNGEPRALLELTNYDSERYAREEGHEEILDRLRKSGAFDMYAAMSGRLGIPAYVVMFKRDMTMHHVYSLTKDSWLRMTGPEYVRWIRKL